MAALRITICGTDTEVGKTVLAAAMARAALDSGHSVRVLKPVQTGAGADDDGAEVDRLCGARVARTGWRLTAPLAPSVAARMEDRRLNPSEIVEWTLAAAEGADVAIVETAGGSAVQLDGEYDMAALAADLGYPVVVACRPGLGTLNHTLLTVNHLRQAGSRLLGLVVAGYPDSPGLAERSNLVELPRITGLAVVGVIPVLREVSMEALQAASAWLSPSIGGAPAG
ncbi:MAG: dethiobiotin synthase [Candidatus Dormibacteria bacterium]